MKVVYTPIAIGAARDAASVNAIYTAIANASAAVEADNLAEQGIDERALLLRPWVRVGEVVDTVRTNIAPPGAFAAFAQSVPLRTGAIGALGADEVLRIRSMVWAESTISNGIGLSNNLCGFRHAFNDGTVTAATLASERYIQHVPAPSPVGAFSRQHGNFYIESWLVGPVTTVAWVEIQHTQAAGTLWASVSWLVVDKGRRQEFV